jgi:hypothetical protein
LHTLKSKFSERRAVGRSEQLPSILPQYLQNQPRYVLDDQWSSDANDRSFSLGSDEEEEDDYNNGQILIRSAQHSDEEGESATEEGNMEGMGRDEEDDNDSDYEVRLHYGNLAKQIKHDLLQVGRAERETVFRYKWTIN